MILGHILVIRPGALGDSMLTLSVLSALYRVRCGYMTVLGTPASFEFLRSDNDVAEIRDFSSSGWLGLFAEDALLSVIPTRILKRTNTAIVYLNGDTDAIANRLASFGVERTLFIAPPKASELDLSRTGDSDSCRHISWRELGPLHAARQLLDPLASLVSASFRREALNPAIFKHLGWLYPTDNEVDAARRFLDPQKCDARKYFAIHPGSGGRKKCWPAVRFAELAARIAREMDCEPLVFFGPADDQVHREFEAAMPPDVIWRAIAHRPLREVLALLHSCAFFVGNDSGMSHLAARAVPTLAIFGPTNPDVWAPIGENVSVVTAANRDLNLLAVETVLNAVLNLKPDKSRARK